MVMAFSTLKGPGHSMQRCTHIRVNSASNASHQCALEFRCHTIQVMVVLWFVVYQLHKLKNRGETQIYIKWLNFDVNIQNSTQYCKPLLPGASGAQ
jgi:hypothetical protein